MVSLLLPVILFSFYQPGPAGCPAGCGLAQHVPGLGRGPVLGGHDLHDHLRRYSSVQPGQRRPYRSAWPRQGHGHQRGHDGRSAVWLFHLHGVLAALSVGRALRPGRGQRGCRPQQLRCPALREPPHELAALHVGPGRQRRAGVIMGWALAHSSWQSGYRIISVLQVVLTTIIIFSLPLCKKPARRPARKSPASTAPSPS